MKARMQQELALLYHLDAGTEKGDRVRKALDSMGVPYKTVEERALLQQVGAAAGLAGFTPGGEDYSGPAPQGEGFILKDFTEKRLNQLLAALKEAQTGPLALKAVLTQSNKDWTFLQLFAELRQEHETIEAYNALRALTVQTREKLSGTQAPPETARALDSAQTLLDARRPLSVQELLDAGKTLCRALDGADPHPPRD